MIIGKTVCIICTFSHLQLEELDEKERQMKRLAIEQDRNTKIHQITQEKTKKDVHIIKKQLVHER